MIRYVLGLCVMHLTPGVIHNFPKAVSVQNVCSLCAKTSHILSIKESGGNPGFYVNSSLQWMVVYYPRMIWETRLNIKRVVKKVNQKGNH